MAKLTKEQVKEKIREKKVKRALKIARFRGLKNFLFWFAGVLSSFAILLGSVFVAVKVIPISTYVGGKNNYADYVSDNVAYKSVLDAILEIQNFKVSDFPIVETTLKDLLNDTKIDGNTSLSDVIKVDYDKLNAITFKGDIAGALAECISFNEDGINDKVIGTDSSISVFKDYIQVPAPSVDGQGLTAGNPKLYYYKAPVTYSARVQDFGWARVFNDDGTFADGVTMEAVEEFFICPILKLPITEALKEVGTYLNYLKVNEILDVVKTDKQSLVYKAFRGVAIGSFISSENGGFSADMILKNICLNDLGGPSELGDIGNLDFFAGYVPVEEDDRPEVVGDVITKAGEEQNFTSNPAMYYVLVEGVHGQDTAVYARAFNDNGQFNTTYYKQADGTYLGQPQQGINPDKFFEDYEKTDLYYANLSFVPFSDALNLIGETIGMQTVPGLMKAMEIDLGENDLIFKLLGDYTIADFGKSEEDGGFSANSLLSKITLNDLGGAELFGDFGGFTFFNEYTVVENDDRPILDGDYIGKDSNSKLYYTLVQGEHGKDGAVYARAFTDDGLLITCFTDGATVIKSYDSYSDMPLYYANLASTPFDQALELIGESIGRETIPGVMSALGLAVGTDSFIEKLLNGYTIEDFGKPVEEGGFDINKILITDLLGDGNEDLYKLLLSAINKMPDKAQFVVGGVLDQTAYDQAVDQAIKELTIGNLMGEFDIEGIPISEFIELDDDILKMLCESINANKKAEYDDNTDPNKGEYQEVTKDNLTIGDFKYFGTNGIKLSAFLGEYAESQTLYDVLMSATDKMPNRNSFGSDAEYELAKKQIAEDLTADDLSNGLNIESVKLSVILPNDKGENDGVYKILVQALNITDASGNPITNPTFADITIKHFKNGFDLNKVSLTTVLGDYSSNKTLYDVLVSAKGLMPNRTDFANDSDFEFAKANVAQTLTVGALSSGLKIEDVNLSVVLENNADNKGLYDILLKALKVTDSNGVVIANPTVDDIKIKHLSSFSSDKITLSSVIDPASNSGLYDILVQTVNKARLAEYNANTALDKGEFVSTTEANLTVGDFKYFKTENILLSSVLSQSENQTIYNLLAEATGVNAQDITLSSLKNFKTGGVRLVSVMPYDDTVGSAGYNADLYKILVQATKATSYDKITVDSLKNFSVGNVNMGTALPNANDTLKAILEQALPGDTTYENILISDLGDFSIGNVNLQSVLSGVAETDMLAQVLAQATNKSYGNITINDLSGSSFTLDNVQLETVLHENTDNPILNALLSDKENPVTVGTLSQRISQLTVFSVYGGSVFTDKVSDAMYSTAYYKILQDGKLVGYTSDANDSRISDTTKYYLSKNSGIWGLVCLDAVSIYDTGEDKGRAIEYAVCNLTVNDMENGTQISSKLKNATIRRLIDAGVLESANNNYYDKTMSDILAIIS